MTIPTTDPRYARAQVLGLHGLIAHWNELTGADVVWVTRLLDWEETERQRRGLERRLAAARIGRFKPLVDFDWDWLEHCDREAAEDLMRLDFIEQATNAVLVGPVGTGKSTVVRNLAYQAVLHGHTALFVTAAEMLIDLAAQETAAALGRRLKRYLRPRVLVIDELGYLSYGDRHADLLFEVISGRYENKPTLVTTARPFAEWGELFPNASCVVSLVDRLVHNAEILTFKGQSWRLKEAQERAAKRAKERAARRRARRKRTPPPDPRPDPGPGTGP